MFESTSDDRLIPKRSQKACSLAESVETAEQRIGSKSL